MIITVKQADTLYSVAIKYSVPVSKLSADNGVGENETLVVGQSLVVDVPRASITVAEETTAAEVSEQYGITEKQLFRNNYVLSGKQQIKPNTFVVLEYENEPENEKIIGGYAYDFISNDRLLSVINYLTYVMPFTYGFTPEGGLVEPDDDYILDIAKNAGVMPLMHISTLTEQGLFDSNLPSQIFGNFEAEQKLIDNILQKVEQKGYGGVDIDFEYLPLEDKTGYASFIAKLSEALHKRDKILVVAVPPKTSDEQRGLLVEGIDYLALGENADYVLIMAYEYGYKFGPAMAVAPVNKVREVLDYAVTRIPREKLLLGISNYGYDWTLPYVEGQSDAPSISTVEAVRLARENDAQIMYDEASQAPYFFYTDREGRVHEVWFEDARSFEAKINLIEEYGLAGGFIWDLMRENPQGFVTINSLIKIT